MGSTMLARDAANGRLGFLFSRPLSWPTIWDGKWLAALVLVASSGVLAAIPFMVVYPAPSDGAPRRLVAPDHERRPGTAGSSASASCWSRRRELRGDGLALAVALGGARHGTPRRRPLVHAALRGAAVALRRPGHPTTGALSWRRLLLAFGLLLGQRGPDRCRPHRPASAHRALSLVFWAVWACTLPRRRATGAGPGRPARPT